MVDPPESREWSRVLELLGRFGLSAREAQLYTSLLRRGRATANELAREAGLDRVLSYRILDGLRARGVVETTAERPRRYVPTPPSVLLERVVRERREAWEKDQELARGLAEDLGRSAAPDILFGTRFQVVTGKSRVYDYLREMVARGESEIAVMITYRTLRESLELGLQDRIAEFARKGGHFRLLVEADPRIKHVVGRVERAARRFPRMEFRQLFPQPTRMTLIDASEALLFLVPEAIGRQSEQVAIWSNGRAFVAGQRQHFDRLWETASKLPNSTRVPRRTD